MPVIFIKALIFALCGAAIVGIRALVRRNRVQSAKHSRNFLLTVEAAVKSVWEEDKQNNGFAIKGRSRDKLLFELEGDTFIAIEGQPNRILLTKAYIISRQRLGFVDILQQKFNYTGFAKNIWRDEAGIIGVDLLADVNLDYTGDVVEQVVGTINHLLGLKDEIVDEAVAYNAGFS